MINCGTSVESVLLVSEGLCSRGLGGGREKDETKEDYARGINRGGRHARLNNSLRGNRRRRRWCPSLCWDVVDL
jgi:hypothetical protein